MKRIMHDPLTGIYQATNDYVHATEALSPARLLFISGTMGLDDKGHAGKTIDEQLELIWSNIAVILRHADMTEQNIVKVTTFLTDPTFADANAKWRMKALGNQPVATTSVIVQTLDPTWLLEIDAIAAA